ncbi:hypothetical protein E1A91_A05G389300v1 [Gossypium mustelinum]|uniref:Uncharacterized protein n=1 Tax=Gossypium mustelinum TaxID=34275 RepID=A0A5D2ZH73_GOSMU|nr:hypothetical protein E1A91_A05G389300v1 [Gossypium mustelinum]
MKAEVELKKQREREIGAARIALQKDSHSRSKKHRSNSLRSSSQNSESSDTQELYLELRLSL